MTKRFIRGIHNMRKPERGCVATIGNFDGVHLGHQALVEQLLEQSRSLDLPSLVMVFEPHPLEFFSTEEAPPRLMRLREKAETLFELGVDIVFCLQFNSSLRQLPAQEFIDRVLVDGIDVRCLITGDDSRFGRDRAGDASMLRRFGRKAGFDVLDTVTVELDGRRVSSSWVREELQAGNLDKAAQLLGRPYGVTGRVIHGQQLGRQIGVPTANVNLHRYRAPLNGVFVADVKLGDRTLPAVSNVGVRPTVAGHEEPLLEVHLLEWSGDIYGERITVTFLEKVRDEHKFESVDALKAQIHKDIDYAREYFQRRDRR